MNIEQKKQLWGNDLFNIFKSNIYDNGWLTSEWAEIIENEIPQFDKDYNDNPKYKETYQLMYNTDFEENEDSSLIRPIDYTKLDENMKLVEKFMKHYENETGNKIDEKIFLSFFDA